MKSVCELKRQNAVNYNLCLFCQRRKANDKLREASEQGLSTLKEATDKRSQLGEDDEVTDRVAEIFKPGGVTQRILWHKQCYCHFTDQEKIRRLENKNKAAYQASTSKDASTKEDSCMRSTTQRLSRRSITSVDWNKCIFCQSNSSKDRLCSIMTFGLSSRILMAAPLDYKLSVGLADVNDLIASEGKYHLSCLAAFDRATERTKKESEKADLAFIWLCKELEQAATRGLVFQLVDVWERYVELAKDLAITIPQSFLSRRATFKEKLVSQLNGEFHFFQPLNVDPSKRQTLLIPTQYQSHAVSQLAHENEFDAEDISIPSYQPEQDDIFLSLVHVALKIRGDILAKPGHKGLSVSEKDEAECIPDSLYMFLRLLYGGQEAINGDEETHDENRTRRLVSSTAHDLIYGVSNGKKWTPKHIGLTSTLHQATRSKDLVNIFHRAGHCLSYKQLLQVDTALANDTLQSVDQTTGAVIPKNFVANEFIHFTADNIDILDESLDGKNTFHATQLAAYQRSTGKELNLLATVEKSSKNTLNVPDILEELLPVKINEGKANPVFQKPVDPSWFDAKSSILECEKKAAANDQAFLLHRQEQQDKPSWTSFNQQNSATNHNQSSVGHLPIIPAPAHQFDTLNTVVRRCMSISHHFGQQYTVITVDQALYCKLMELKWIVTDYKTKLIPRLGGLHISMNFLKVIGKHMAACGLYEAWIESGILGPGAAELVFSGKAYKKAMRAHKQSIQALWRILIPKFFKELAQINNDLYESICSIQGDCDKIAGLVAMIQGDTYKKIFAEFIESECEKNVNFHFWWGYMEMVSILLMFTRAQREGNWDLYIASFVRMVPFFYRYDHQNYARWGTIYIAEMKQLPDEVKEEFAKGNFVVKCSATKFNEVDPDHAQEWLNGTGKRAGGIRFKVFAVDTPGDILQNIATKELASNEIQESLLHAAVHGEQQLVNFVTHRLIPADKEQPMTSFNEPMRRCKALNFQSLYEIKGNSSDKDKKTVVKADRNILMRLITAYEGGREVDLKSVLSHELMPVPLSLAEMNGSLRTGNKSVLIEKLTEGINCPESIDLNGKTACLVIDGQALVVSLGKPNGCSSFGDLADTFVQAVLQMGKRYHRIDVVFDRYRQLSIKAEEIFNIENLKIVDNIVGKEDITNEIFIRIGGFKQKYRLLTWDKITAWAAGSPSLTSRGYNF
eukprot:Seg940.1 transcript_id=Seg940.1/GoldUCD/mRNA.D3Y31 product="hypothetical protein" protein_id=Seg940.1/GoldUCD/D3Y31